MAMQMEKLPINIPDLPVKHEDFIKYVTSHPDTPMPELLKPFHEYDSELRKAFAQQPDHPATQQPNVVPVFSGQEHDIKIRARNLKTESDKEKDSYIMPLDRTERKANGSPAIVQSLSDFKTNFSLFTEQSLADMDWSNVCVAGSAVVTALLPVPEQHNESKKALRKYYHETLAPASDVDLFLYGLTEEEAIVKIHQIEQKIKDALLVETTTIRTKNAITIASQYPTRHVQIVLRIYKSISEILTGFDVDCSCGAFDGNQVWVSPRALAAYMTQVNTIDLTRRSPSYENRLSKYRHRGFEVSWPELDRSRIDPTIFERSFGRTEGLARLLIMEKLPKSDERDAYIDQRRVERGRPRANRSRQKERLIHGNIKNDWENEVAEWFDAEEVSNYHTFTVPYGPQFHARKIEKLLYTKDLLLNSEWNKPKDREVNLHRHPAFFGDFEDVKGDCCSFCPIPSTMEEEEVAAEEQKVFVSGDVTFIKDDPGRQAIGSFNPLSADDYTEMAYVGNTQLLCQAIVDGDIDYVRSWVSEEGNDPNTRDYTGRTPLHLAVAQSTVEIVQCLIDNGSRLVARLVDGKTALHLAAIRGDVQMISAILRKSEANEEEEDRKVDARRKAHKAAKDGVLGGVPMKNLDISQKATASDVSEESSDVDMVDYANTENVDATTENSMINVKTPPAEMEDKALTDDNEDEPDVYDVDVLGWDTAISPLHLAIIKGHIDAVRCLVQEFGADVLLPVKLFHDHDRSARAAILTLVLALNLPLDKAQEMSRTLFELGASSAQGDVDGATAFHYAVKENSELLESYVEIDRTGVSRAINNISVSGYQYGPAVSNPFITALLNGDGLTALHLLKLGALPGLDFERYMKVYQTRFHVMTDSNYNKRSFETSIEQPVTLAIQCEMPSLAATLIDQYGIDPDTLTKQGHDVAANEYSRRYRRGETILDLVTEKIQELRDWKPEEPEHKPPTPLSSDSKYLAGRQEGTYEHWTATQQLESAKQSYQAEWKSHVENVKLSQDRTGWPEKQAAVLDMLNDFRKLEALLKAKKAHTFSQLYPKIEKPEKQPDHGYYQPVSYEPTPFEITFNFNLPDLTDETRAKYMELFEASWRGDTKAVKSLTLTTWMDAKDESRPPLKVAVQGEQGLSPFSIAVMRDHIDLAKVIMEIAEAQYTPPNAPKARQYRMADQEDDDSENECSDDESDGSGPVLASDIVDDEFTVENIGEVSMQVQSRVKPLDMLQWPCPTSKLVAGESTDGAQASRSMSGKRTLTGSNKQLKYMSGDAETSRAQLSKPSTLIELAIYNDNVDLLSWLLAFCNEYTKRGKAADLLENSKSRTFSVSHYTFLYALQAGHPRILAELIKRTGAGIPINKFAKSSGVDLQEKAKYYQGLSVHGQKRKDWAARGRGVSGYEPVEHNRPPLLEAARYGSLESVEWFLSDAPVRCYRQFAQDHPEDKRLQQLSKASGGGFETAVKKFLGARSHLALHCCIIGTQTAESLELLRYLLEVSPDTLEAKSSTGQTPLLIAFRLRRLEAAKLLLEAGADQTARDKLGRNLLHHVVNILQRDEDKYIQRVREMIDLIDPRLLPSMFTERCSQTLGSLTPFAIWQLPYNSDAERNVKTADMLLSYSRGAELDMINGEGDTPLHHYVRTNAHSLVDFLLTKRPELVNRENATGRTAYEMVEDAVLAAKSAGPPELNMSPGFRLRRGSSLPHNGRPHRRSRNSQHRHDSITQVSPSSFIKNRDNETEHEDDMWKLVCDAKARLAAKGEDRRRLVTLNEANEVARRLAATRASRVVSDDASASGDEEDEKVVDEVQHWLGD